VSLGVAAIALVAFSRFSPALIGGALAIYYLGQVLALVLAVAGLFCAAAALFEGEGARAILGAVLCVVPGVFVMWVFAGIVASIA
jgi:hypothetical protein